MNSVTPPIEAHIRHNMGNAPRGIAGLPAFMRFRECTLRDRPFRMTDLSGALPV